MSKQATTRNGHNWRTSIKNQREIFVSILVAFALSGIAVFMYVNSQSPKQVSSPKNSIQVEAGVNIENGANSETALKESEVNWQKKLKPENPTQTVDGYIIEKIDISKQVYVRGSMQLPEGWTAEWSLSPSNTPEEEIVWTSNEPDDGAEVTFIRINTGNRDSLRPVVQSSIPKPPNGVQIDRTGYKPSGPVIYDKKIYQVMMAVNVLTDASKYTLDCYDLATYARCNDYPKYVSSVANSDLTSNSQAGSGPAKDLSTAMNLQIVQGSGDNDGKIYIPVQKTTQYGVACIDLKNQKNCGFTVLGSVASTPAGTQNPSALAGFAEKDSKIYGHANDTGQARQVVVCFDMTTNAQCSGYSDTTLSALQNMDVSLHGNSYRTPGMHIISGNRLMWLVQYRHGASNLAATQAQRGSVMSCFDLSTRLPCTGTGNNEGWTHFFGGQPSFTNSTSTLGAERGYAMFIWKIPDQNSGDAESDSDDDYDDKAVCVVYGLANGVDPSRRCFDIGTGIFLTGAEGFPPLMFPTQWMIIPWQSAPNIVTITGKDGHLRSYFPMYNTNTGNGSVDLLPYAQKRKGAALCYDWQTQRPCDQFGNKLRYWHEINGGNSGDVGYVYDGKCMWATGDFGNIWSFDPTTGEQPCRTSKVELTVSTEGRKFHCDGQERVFEWDRVRLAKSSMYNFDSFEVIVKDNDDATDDGSVEGTVLEQGDIRSSGYLDISDISFEDHDELDIEVRPTALNDSPWANDQTPFVAALLEADEVQYCYKTRVKDKCNIKSVSTTSSASLETETDILSPSGTKIVPVDQPDNVRCFQDLRVTPSVSKNQVANNEEFTYTAQVNNKANTDDNNLGSIPNAENPELAGVEITIPNGVSFVAATPGAVRQGNKLIWGEVAVAAQSNKDFSVTVRTPASVAMMSMPSATTLYAATVQQQLVFQSQALFAGDDDPSDNVSTTTITFNNDVPDSSGGGDGGQNGGGTDGGSNSGNNGSEGDGGTTDGGIDPDPEPINELTEPERIIVEPSPFNLDYNLSRSPGSLTPRFVAAIIPPNIRDQTEAVFRFVNSAISPIPNPVAAALPYGTIAFLIAFASIYVYQGFQANQSRKQMIAAYRRFKRTEELRRNYVDLTSHYLNTPIATMQSSVELLALNKELPAAITEAAKQRIGRIVEHVRLLLGKADELTRSAEATARVIEPVAKKRRLLSFGVMIPIIIVLIITAVINALFVWADKYSASTFTLAVQGLYFALSAVAMVLAFNVYRNQKYASALAERELGLEKKLTQSQTAFIANTSKTIDGDLVELEQMAPTFAETSRGPAFVSGFQDLKSATSKLEYLNQLTNHAVIPSLPNQTIKSLTDDVIQSLKSYADEKRVTIETNIQSGLTALVDEDGLRRMLYSTLHNGIKFNAPGGRVVLSIIRRSESQITVTIQDNGQGISSEKIDQLFTPFGRGTSAEEYNFEGFGLDLYMNKLIAEQCGGSINLESTEGAGTTVTIQLPS